MSSHPLNFVVILATNRTNRKSENVAHFVMDAIAKRDDINATLFDVRDFPLPVDDYGQALKETEPYTRYRQAVIDADGVIIVTPEYNHGYPGTLKSLLDIVLREYIHKAVGFVGVSAGAFGGARGIENLLPVTRELGLVASSVDLNIPNVSEAFDNAGAVTDKKHHDRTAKFLDELTWLAHTLRWGREHVKSAFD